MFKNYLKIIIKNLAGHKIYSFINISGLGIGLACCLAITLFVYQELSYDRHYENSERIFRVGRLMRDGGDSLTNSFLAAPLLKQDFAEIENVARFQNRALSVARGQVEFLESSLGFADSSFFEIFDFQWLEGSPDTALTDPAGIVLTRSLADKYFGDEDPLGKTLLLDGTYSVRVTGVIEDLPPNTHLRAQALASMTLFETIFQQAGTDINVWNFSAVNTYVLLRENAAIESLEDQFTDFVNRHIPSSTTQIAGMFATNIRDIHMSEGSRGMTIGNRAKTLIFSAIASCILLIAVINFINLSMARYFWRAKEVGIRKSIGAGRVQIIQQFLFESMTMTTIAMLVAMGLVEIFLPLINLVINQNLSFSYLPGLPFFIGVFLFTLVLGVVVGYYPALRMSAYQLSGAIKGEHNSGRGGIWLRNGLVILQFTISIALIVSATVVFLQMKITRNMDLGFDKEQVIVFSLPALEKLDINVAWPSFRSRLLSDMRISNVTHSLTTPLQPATLEIELGRDDGSVEKAFVMMQIEPNYFDTYGINLLAGRYFSADLNTDYSRVDRENPDSVQGSVILSEQTARELGWAPAEAVGQTVKRGSVGRLTVVGVVEDTVPSVKTGSFANFYTVPGNFNYGFARGVVSVKIAGGNVADILEHIDAIWNEFVPGESINRYFLDSEVRALYQQEQMQMRMFTYAALLAVLIACFGLFGLAAFTAERRTKEIGVRKVMGGSVWSIVLLLTNDFSKLVLLSNLIAWPLAYIAMERWLQNFAYRIDLTPLIFIGSGAIALSIAWVTVGGTAAKAASAKPVLALRYE